MTIEIDDARAEKIVKHLQRCFDTLERVCAEVCPDVRQVIKRNWEYNGLRDGIAMAGIRIRFDRHTKRPIGIEAMKEEK